MKRRKPPTIPGWKFPMNARKNYDANLKYLGEVLSLANKLNVIYVGLKGDLNELVGEKVFMIHRLVIREIEVLLLDTGIDLSSVLGKRKASKP